MGAAERIQSAPPSPKGIRAEASKLPKRSSFEASTATRKRCRRQRYETRALRSSWCSRKLSLALPPVLALGLQSWAVLATEVASVCGAPALPVAEVQGAGSVSPRVGQVVTIEAVVVGDFQGSAGLRGFFLQEEDDQDDGDPTTSDGIFVFDDDFGVDVVAGDVVRVRGTVVEYNDLTELSDVEQVQVCASGVMVTARELMLPAASLAELEALEGMSVHLPQTLYVTEHYDLGRFGEVRLAVDGRLPQPTQVAEPGAGALLVQAGNDLSWLQLDDGSSVQNPAVTPYLGLEGTLRGGDAVVISGGVFSHAFGAYEIHPTAPVDVVRDNPRTEPPARKDGHLRAASLNVHNYFTTLDTGQPRCGPRGGLGCRGANTPSEFTRQREKIIEAIARLDADVVGLLEIENDAGATLSDLVDGLNQRLGSGTFDFVDTGAIGTDAIKVALIYRPTSVELLGAHAILDSTLDWGFADDRNRPVLAQSFMELSSGESFTVAVNHLKSKGSSCDDVGDPDLGDGQGNCNLTRTAAVEAELLWLADDPTGSGDPDVLLIGDFNAYAMEDPIAAIRSAGYTDLIERFEGAEAYSYVFQGQWGYLDHALASAALSSQVVGAVVWHINADEPRILGYDQEYNPPAAYEPGPYRSADHDPLLIDLKLGNVPFCHGLRATIFVRNGTIVGGPGDGLPYLGHLRGSSGADVIVGTDGADVIHAGGGADVVCALDGDDSVQGGSGPDWLSGGGGADVLSGGPGDDELYGDAGDDVLHGGTGSDRLEGGSGDDQLRGGCGHDWLNGGWGADQLHGGPGRDDCDGGPGPDRAHRTCESRVGLP